MSNKRNFFASLICHIHYAYFFTNIRRKDLSDEENVFFLPDCPDEFSCLPQAVALQLLSYYTAEKRGCDIDKPKNLAKSVTVE